MVKKRMEMYWIGMQFQGEKEGIEFSTLNYRFDTTVDVLKSFENDGDVTEFGLTAFLV